MSLSIIVQAVTAAAGDFGRHTNSTPPKGYFDGIGGLLDHPFDGLPFDHPAMEKVRLLLALDRLERDRRTSLGLRTGSASELRRLGFAGVAA